MARRIEVELTSSRDDGTWTWRAAGAKQPKGDLNGTLLFEGAAVGDVVKVDAEFLLDGIEITAVHPPKNKTRNEPERLELLGSGSNFEPVTTQLVGKRGRGDRGDRGDRGGRGGRDDRGGRGGRGGGRGGRDDRGGGRGGSGGRGSGDRNRNDRGGRDGQSRPRRRPEAPSRPKPKRLKAQRKHRAAAVAALPEEQRPIADVLLRGSIPAVRTAVEKQNELAEAAGRPKVPVETLVAFSEKILPALETAKWHDRAEAALAGVGELDLRDLRSVVVAADSAAKDDETRALAEQLKAAVATRVETEHNNWLAEIAETLADGRTVRALRLSSRPPKAGSPLPTDMAARLAAAASASLTADTGPDRYATVLDAVAYSPVRTQVKPEGIPGKVTDELTKAITRLSSRIPEIAALFGIAPTNPPRQKRSRGGRGRGKGSTPPVPPPPNPPTPAAEAAPAAETSVAEAAAPVEEAAAPAAESPSEPESATGAATADSPAEPAAPEGPDDAAAPDDAAGPNDT